MINEVTPESTTSTSDPLYLSNLHLTNPALAKTYLESIYSHFKRQYNWFKRTQWGQTSYPGRSAEAKFGFRWRGRTDMHTLTSGLDDYPRASPPHAGELHVDLISWVAFYAKTLKGVAAELNLTTDVESFERDYKDMVHSLEGLFLLTKELHWDEHEQVYCDLTVDDDGNSKAIVHKGYISIFPFILLHMDPLSSRLDAILDLIRDEKHLWTPYGLSSLSKSDPLRGKGENYWRGPVWVNINYLALAALKYYSELEGPYKAKAGQIYSELRENLVENVFNVYQRTGFMWEQYSPNNGEGRRSHPFSGWTSLVTLIMAEKY